MASKIVDGQTYVFISWGNLDVIDLTAGNGANETPVLNYRPHLDDNPENQVWRTKAASGDSFQLINVKGESVLDLYRGDRDGKLQGYKAHNGDNQKWIFESASTNADAPSFFIKSVATGQVATVPGGNPASGTVLQALDVGKGQSANWSRWVAIPFKL